MDRPHIYLTDWGSTPAKLKELYKTPEKFKETWNNGKPTEIKEEFLLSADATRWWYQFKDGTFAKNGCFWLTESTTKTSGWYLFDKNGYMLTGYQKDLAGETFFLCPEKGVNEGKCMVTNLRGVLKIVEKYDFESKKYLME